MGVHPSASQDQLRQAYRDLARRLQPDRQAGASAPELALAERRMREINQAWEVLGDRAARRRYDEALDRGSRVGPTRPGPSRGGPSPRTTTSPPPPGMPLPVEDDDLIDAAPHLGVSGSMAMRGLPWLAVLVVLVAIFFFTAYASAGKHDAPTPTGRPAPGDCFVLDTGMPVKALCTAKGAEQLKDVVARDALCPDGSEERFFGDKQEKYCVASI